MTVKSITTGTSKYAQDEWETRLELAALYRVLHHHGMTDIANQEVGARVKGEPDCFLIHPYGLLFEEVCASDFVKIKLDGTVVDGPGYLAGQRYRGLCGS